MTGRNKIVIADSMEEAKAILEWANWFVPTRVTVKDKETGLVTEQPGYLAFEEEADFNFYNAQTL